MTGSNDNSLCSILLGSAIALFFGIALGLPATGHAQKSPSWGKETQNPVGAQQLIPSLKSDEAYTERYLFNVDLDGGGHIGIDFTISNLGWGDGHGAVQVRVKRPDRPNYSFKKELSKGKWNYSKDHFMIDMANTRVEASNDKQFVLTHTNKGTNIRLVFDKELPIWKPGSGQLRKGSKLYKLHLIAASADVTGTVEHEGKTQKVDVEDTGYSDHVMTNIAPYNLAKRFARFRTRTNGVFIAWREIHFTDEYGGGKTRFVVMAYKGQYIFSAIDPPMTVGRTKNDPASGYTFPMQLQINANSGGDEIKLAMHGSDFKRQDLLDKYGYTAKLLASSVTSPYRYTVNCQHNLKMSIGGTTATISGDSHFTLDYLNE